LKLTIPQGHRLPTNPYAVLLIGILGATFAAPFIKMTQQTGMPSPLIAAGRLLLAATIYTPFILTRYRGELAKLSSRDLLLAIFAGVWIASHFILLITALEYTSVLINQVIVNTGPIWAAILERFFLRSRLSRTVWLGMMVSFVGGGVIALAGASNPSQELANPTWGNTLALLGAVAGAAYLTIGRSVRMKVSLWPYVWIVFGTGGIFALLYVFATGTPITGHPPESYFWLVMLTIAAQLIGHASFNFSVGYLPAAIVTLAGQVVTVTAGIAGYFLFDEVPTVLELVGCAIIVTGVLMAIQGRRQKRKSPA
jgi:drug/metabolite transporter (DMT)-like permease